MNKLYLRANIGVRYDLPLIDHFIKYYKNLGVERFLICLHSLTEDDPNLKSAISILNEHGIEPADIWIGKYRERKKSRRLEGLVEDLNDDDWILTADADEFQEYPINLIKFIKKCETNNVAAVHGLIVDRIKEDGSIPNELEEGVPILEQFPLECNFQQLKNLSHRKWLPKVTLHKKWVVLTIGNHCIDNPSTEICKSESFKHYEFIKVFHAKWFGEVVEKMDKMYEQFQNLSEASSFQTNRVYFNYFQKNNKVELSSVAFDNFLFDDRSARNRHGGDFCEENYLRLNGSGHMKPYLKNLFKEDERYLKNYLSACKSQREYYSSAYPK